MARRAILLFERLVRVPWWLGLIAAAAAYTIFTLVLPPQGGDGTSAGTALRSFLALFAWLGAVLFTVVALFSLARTRLARSAESSARDTAWIRALSWEQFSSLIDAYWRGRGFEVIEPAERAEDDLLLVLAHNRQRHLVRYAHWRSLMVGAAPVRDLFSVMKARDASRAFLVVSGHFNEEAIEFAEDKPVELIDGAELAEMLEEARRATVPGAGAESDPPSAPRRCA